jgi:WD40 repeat protein
MPSPTHDAFISYRHDVDANLAAAIEAGLEKLARPLLKLRALDVFRDKTSLPADSGLWRSILSHLSGARWFLLMASPESADSKYCRKELEWWLENRSVERMLVILTDGEIVWNDATRDFDWNRTKALSPVLKGKLTEEPLYVDLRWHKSQADLTLKDSRFRNAILDLAAPIRGVPKDQLDGEDVRQFKRNRRFVRGLQISIAFAAVIAVIFAVIAFFQRNEAIRQRNEAVRQAQVALSQKLSADALRTTDDNIDRALLLGLTAFDTYPTTEARLSLFVTLLRGRYAKFERGHAQAGRTRDGSSFSCEMNFEKIQETTNKGGFQDGPDFNDPDFRNGTCYAISGGESRIAVITAVPRRAQTIRYPANLAIWNKSRQKKTAATIHFGDITAFKFSQDGKSLVSGDSHGVVLLWRYKGSRGWYYERLYGHRHAIRRVDFDSGGRMLVTESADGDILHWDLRRPQSLAVVLDDQRTYKPQDFGWTRVAFAKNGRLIIALGTSGRLLAWDNSTMVGPARELTAISGDARSLTVSNNGEWVAIASDQEICVLHIDSGKKYASPLSCQRVAGLSFSIDNETVAIGGIRCFLLWRYRSEKTPQTVAMPGSLAGRRIYATRFTPDGSALIMCGAFGVLKWALQSKSKGAPLQVLYRGGLVTKIALSRDGRRLAAGLWEGDVAVFSLFDPKDPPMKLIGHRRGAITGLAFSPEADILASCDGSGITMLWDLNRGELLVSELKSAGITATGLAFSPDGSAFAIGSDDRVVTVWPFGLDAWRERACAIANRELTPEEWQFFVPDQPYRSICRGEIGNNNPQ